MNRRFGLYLVLFVASGAVALVYQVIWLRRFGLLFGSTASAASATLGAFMAGLGLGGHLGGRLGARTSRPLRLYALLEMGVAAGALLVEPLLSAADPFIGWLYGTGAARGLIDLGRLAASLLVLLPPTVFMGATLPALARAAVRSKSAVAAPLGVLYGGNTLGAAGGALLTALVLLEHLGAGGAFALAVALNIAVALLAFLASSGEPEAGPLDATPPPGVARERRPRRLVLAAFALSGAAALTCEVVWTRMLVFYVGNSTYAFALMLTLVLLGLAFGSLLMSRLGDRISSSPSALALVLGSTAAGIAAGTLLLPALASALEPWAMERLSWSRMLAYMGVLTGATIFLPAIGFGAVFPLVAREGVLGGRGAASATGAAYAANLAGAVGGAYVAGFVLVPNLGLSQTLSLVMAVLFGFAALLVSRDPLAARRPRLAAAVLLALAIASFVLPVRPLHRPGPGESLVHYEEGASATVSVIRDPLGAKTIYIDGVAVAGTDPVMQTDQKSLAHLPLLLHPEPRRVLTVGFGSGGASWSYTRYPMLELIDCVEIAEEVVRAAPYLREANHDLFEDPRYRVVIDDARSHLQYGGETYDVIATDCTDLQYRGNASLYTSDYFDLCRRRLRPRGLVVVWMPLGGMSDPVFRMALNTFASVFPHVSVWYMNNYPTHYLLLVGSEEEHAFDWDELLARVDIPEVRADLESIGLSNPLRFLSTFLLDDETLRAVAGSAEINRDARPLLEFRAPRSTDRFAGAKNLEMLLAASEASDALPPLVTRYGPRQRETVLGRLEPYLASAQRLNRGHVAYQNGLQDFEQAVANYREAVEVHPEARAEVEALVGATERTRDELLRAYELAAAERPDAPGVLLNLGLTLLAAGKAREAVAVFEQLVGQRPALVDGHLNLSRAALGAGDVPRALAAAEAALAREPGRPEAHFQRALVLERLGRREDAIQAYREVLRIRPHLVEARFNAGTLLAALGRYESARLEYEHGLALRPGDARARMNLAKILLLQGDELAAAAEFSKVVEEGGPLGAEAAALLGEAAPRAR